MIALAALAAAPAANAGTWERVSGPSGGPQLGLYRDKYGALNIAWAQGSPATITLTRLDEIGQATGSSIVTTGFDGLGGLALLGMTDGSLRLFAAGGRTRGFPWPPSGINSYTSPAGGTTWSFDSSGPFGGAVANAADEIGATIAGNGWIVTSWSGAIVHIGVKPSDGDPSYQSGLGCCGAAPALVTDSQTGSVVVAWLSNGMAEGTIVREILPTPEAQYVLPSGLSQGSFGLAARLKAPGSYVAYVDPAKQKVQLYEYGGGLQTVATGAFRVAKVFAAPDGRLWVVWGSTDGGIWVTRSNKNVTAFEPIRHLELPAGTNGFYNAQGEGSRGPLDLFSDLLIGTTDRGFWRTHVIPQATLSVRATYERLDGKLNTVERADFVHIRWTLTDAGDPVPGAEVHFKWQGDDKHLLTDKHGVAELDSGLGDHKRLKSVPDTYVYAPGYSIVKQKRGG